MAERPEGLHFEDQSTSISRRTAPQCRLGTAAGDGISLPGSNPSGVPILTTDADAVPAADWVERNLRAVHAGADIGVVESSAIRREEARLGSGFLRRAATYSRYDALRERTCQCD